MTNCKQILTTNLIVLHNYFDGLNKIFLDLYPAKFLDVLTKPFFPCNFTSVT